MARISPMASQSIQAICAPSQSDAITAALTGSVHANKLIRTSPKPLHALQIQRKGRRCPQHRNLYSELCAA